VQNALNSINLSDPARYGYPASGDLGHCSEWPHIFHYAQPIPTILHINRESRSFGLEIYKQGLDVEQSLGRQGTLLGKHQWTTLSSNRYELCQHEVYQKEKNLDPSGFLYWCPETDVLFLTAAPSEDAEDGFYDPERLDPLCSNKIAAIWSAKCHIRFGKTRWLAMKQRDFEEVHSHGSTTWWGMEVIFVIASETSEQRRVEMFAELKDKYEESIKGKWIGSKDGVSPEVIMVTNEEEIIREIETRTG
jgi:hypothetical protein